ncbi:unnamed protein product [Paramecium sonneborni]|uniref:Uncharacterized protein n=1 Tax=Paramecium sonneborni TaxID=65129 RepID=A0A8S1Q6K7_9CILI|nr:unnamed protein product [Paramecium sonneborni]
MKRIQISYRSLIITKNEEYFIKFPKNINQITISSINILQNGQYQKKEKIMKKKEINKLLNALKFEAERQQKDFINESILDHSFIQLIQEKIVEFHENKVAKKHNKDQLIAKNQRSAQMQQQIQFVLLQDDNKKRAQTIYKKLINTSVSKYKSTLNDKQEQRINQIMNTKFLL